LVESYMPPKLNPDSVLLAVPIERAMQRILIADDQPHVAEALRLVLKNDGFLTELADSPAQILAAARERPFDLVLLDLNYARDTTSGQEGLELLAELRVVTKRRRPGNLKLPIIWKQFAFAVATAP